MTPIHISLSAALYTEAHNIASNEAVKNNISSATVDSLQEHLSAIADFQDAVLWIINNNGEIIVSTRKNIAIKFTDLIIVTSPFGSIKFVKWNLDISHTQPAPEPSQSGGQTNEFI